MKTLGKVTIFLALVALSACGRNEATNPAFGTWRIENPVNVSGSLTLAFTADTMVYEHADGPDTVAVVSIGADGTVEVEGTAVVCGLEAASVRFTVLSSTTAEMKCLLGFFAGEDIPPYRLTRVAR